MARVQFSQAQVRLTGFVVSPTRLEEWELTDERTGELKRGSFFVTDLLQGDENGTNIVPLRTEAPLYDAIPPGRMEPLTVDALIERRRNGSVRATVTNVVSNGKPSS